MFTFSSIDNYSVITVLIFLLGILFRVWVCVGVSDYNHYVLWSEIMVHIGFCFEELITIFILCSNI